MRTQIAFLFIVSLFLVGCSHIPTQGTIIPLSFYIVSEEKMDGGRFIDTPDFPKLGYIDAEPDLVVTTLSAVKATVLREQVSSSSKGDQTSGEIRESPALDIVLQPDDAKKFQELTGRAVGKRVLLMLDERPLLAPRVRDPILTSTLELTFHEQGDHVKIEEGLKKLVR